MSLLNTNNSVWLEAAFYDYIFDQRLQAVPWDLAGHLYSLNTE